MAKYIKIIVFTDSSDKFTLINLEKALLEEKRVFNF